MVLYGDIMKCYYSDDSEASWTEITGITEFPSTNSMLDKAGACVIKLADMEGALYTTYEPLDFAPIKVEDDSSNIIFKGYIKRKQFKSRELVIHCSGIAEKLQWIPFNKNYILADGKISDVLLDVTDFNRIVRPNADGATLEWEKYPDSGSCYTKVDDDVTQPDAPDDLDTYLWAYHIGAHDDSGESVLIRFETFSGVTAASIDEVVVWFYGEDTGAPGDMSIDVDCGGLIGPQTQGLSNSPGWHSKTFVVANKSQADLDGLEVKFTAGALGANEEQIIYACYCVVEYDGTHNNGIELTDGEDASLGWTADDWVNDRDVGILVTDNTDSVSFETWECTNIDVWGEDAAATGDVDSLDTSYDDDVYYCYQTKNSAVFDMNIGDGTETGGMTLGGANIPTTQTLHKIIIDFRYGLKLSSYRGQVTLQIYDGTNWINLAALNLTSMADFFWDTSTREITGTNAELAAYLTVDGANYDELKGLRFKCDKGGYGNPTLYFKLDKLTATIEYESFDIIPIMEQITDNGVSWIITEGQDWSISGIDVGDYFKIGQNTTQILADIFAECGIVYDLDTTLTKYIARHYKGISCYDILKSICLLEGLHWWEDYTNDQIKIAKETDFIDSTVDLTSADYDHDWEYEDDCNHYRKIEVYGQAALNIYAFKENLSSTSLIIKTIIDETISTTGDAQEVADTQYAELSTKRPSIKLTLNGIQSNLTVGKTVTITLERPTVAEADYPIRRIDRARRGIDGIKTVIYAGLGESPTIESLANTLKKTIHLATKAHSDRLISTTATAGASFSWGDIGGADAGARAACVAQTITNGVTTSAPSQDVVYDDVIVWKTVQHNREISPCSKEIPQDGLTAGDNNVYEQGSNGRFAFGKDSKTAASFLDISYWLPSDYVDGEDCTLKIDVRHVGNAAEDIDYTIDVDYAGDGETWAACFDETDSWPVTADKQQFQSLTITGTNLSAEDKLRIRLYMEDQDNVDIVGYYGSKLIIPVNTRD